MWKRDRRQFLQESGLIFGFATLDSRLGLFSDSHVPPESSHFASLQSGEPEKASMPLYNINLQTAVGLGGERAGIIDGHGQLESRNAKVCLLIGKESQSSRDFQWSQTLEEGYFPIVETEARSPNGSVVWSTYASNSANIQAEYLEVTRADLPYNVRLWFPYTTKIEVANGDVTSGGQVLAHFSGAEKTEVSQAKYNFLTPESETSSLSTKHPGSPAAICNCHPQTVGMSSPGKRSDSSSASIPGIDPAFSSGRTSFLFRPLRYSFPVQKGKIYHVVLGLISKQYHPKPGEVLLKLSANDVTVVVDMADLEPGKPYLHDFVVHASAPEIRIESRTDPSSTSPFRYAQLNGIWLFDRPVDLEQVKVGKLSRKAIFYVRCGQELLEDVACSVDLRYAANKGGKTQVQLPYNLRVSDLANGAALSYSSARPATKQQWETLLQGGAEFSTGNDKLDGLYKTSLINIFLLRAKHRGIANDGQDLYVLKPGASIYDAFWYRDGAYLATALDVAGHSDEAEKSLRLFWQSGLPGNFASYEQQDAGVWQAPLNEFDGQGQALWALVHHSAFSGDLNWSRTVYPSIRKGAMWIRNVTGLTKILTENGARPTYYGLLPPGEGEAIGEGYIFYHDYWAVLGLRMAIQAATALSEEQDVKWMTETYSEFCANLLASVKGAFERIGLSEYIPATPFRSKSELDIWGSIAALYPTRFLNPNDPMISRTLNLMKQNCQENEYTFFSKKNKIWTYITVDWAMCYLIQGDLAMFYRLFDGYVAHASPTNAWIEEIFLDSHIGTGDMPHGWAAAQYVHLHRNSLVFEDADVLHLCWGAREEWVNKGITVKKAPTKFGTIDFQLRRADAILDIDFKFVGGEHRETCRQIQLHIPPSQQAIHSVRVNGTIRPLQTGQAIIPLQ